MSYKTVSVLNCDTLSTTIPAQVLSIALVTQRATSDGWDTQSYNAIELDFGVGKDKQDAWASTSTIEYHKKRKHPAIVTSPNITKELNQDRVDYIYRWVSASDLILFGNTGFHLPQIQHLFLQYGKNLYNKDVTWRKADINTLSNFILPDRINVKTTSKGSTSTCLDQAKLDMTWFVDNIEVNSPFFVKIFGGKA